MVKLDPLTDIEMLLMVENISDVEYVKLYINIQKVKTNAWKIMIKIKESSYLKYWDGNNFLVEQCHKSWP